MTGAGSASARPGWYRDPNAPATVLRWWDGAMWTVSTRPAPAAPQPPKHAGHNERVGRFMVIAQSVLPVVETAVVGWAAAAFVRDLIPWLDAVADTQAGDPVPALPSTFLLIVLSGVVSLLGWAPLALEISWTYRAASTAAALGLPAKREPLWAIVAWFIPVVSLWFPYESVRDSLPPGHPARRNVAWWWGSYLVCGFGSLLGIGAALISPLALAAAVVVVAAVSVTMAVHGVRMVRAVDESHRALLAGDAPEAPDVPAADAARATS